MGGHHLPAPSLCLHAGAALIADLTGGRFILSLGLSHQPVNQALEVDMLHPPTALRSYVTPMQSWLRGEGPSTHPPSARWCIPCRSIRLP
jgi:hypothetical protein